MFKITLADGTVVWVDGSYRQEVDEVLLECGVLATEEQDVSTHAPQDAELFDLSGTQNDFKGKQRLRHFALERYIGALKQQLSLPEVPKGLNSDLNKLVHTLSSHTPLEIGAGERFAAAACVLAMLRIQQALNKIPEWKPELLDAVAEQVRAAGLVVLDSDDAAMSPEELEEKYRHEEHPLFKRYAWRAAVEADDTLQGYWAWVHHQLNEE